MFAKLYETLHTELHVNCTKIYFKIQNTLFFLFQLIFYHEIISVRLKNIILQKLVTQILYLLFQLKLFAKKYKSSQKQTSTIRFASNDMERFFLLIRDISWFILFTVFAAGFRFSPLSCRDSWRSLLESLQLMPCRDQQDHRLIEL